MMKDTQMMIEGPLPNAFKGPIKLKPSLETILEVSAQRENEQIEPRETTEYGTHNSRETFPLEQANENLASSL